MLGSSPSLPVGPQSNEDKRRASRSRRSAMVGAVCLLLALLLPFFLAFFRSNSAGASFATTTNDQPINLSTIKVQRDSIKKTLLLDGDLRAVRSRTIYSDTNEEVKIVYLPPEGTVVKAGEKIVELDSSTVLTRIKDTEDRIVAADNEIVKTQSQHEALQRDLEIELSKLWLTYEQAKLKAKIPAEVQARREYQEALLALEKSKTE